MLPPLSNRDGLQRPTPVELQPSSWMLQYLRPEATQRLKQQAQRTLLIPDQVLHEPGQPIERVYFLNSGLVSLTVNDESARKSAEASSERRIVDTMQVEVAVAMVGREGEVGLLGALGGSLATDRAQVQVAGTAYWLTPKAVQAEFERNGFFALWALRFWGAMMEQRSQVALCNGQHSVQQRLCRWLLSTHDRIESTTIESTHYTLGNLIGARRSGITVALSELSDLGLLTPQRGQVELHDIAGLRARSCSCYAALNQSLKTLRTFTQARA